MSRKVVLTCDRHASPYLAQLKKSDKRDRRVNDGQVTEYGIQNYLYPMNRLFILIFLIFSIFLQSSNALDVIVDWSPESVL